MVADAAKFDISLELGMAQNFASNGIVADKGLIDRDFSRFWINIHHTSSETLLEFLRVLLWYWFEDRNMGEGAIGSSSDGAKLGMVLPNTFDSVQIHLYSLAWP